MKLEALAKLLRKHALGYPETYEEAPWGDRVVKVRGKIFFFCGVHAKQLYVTVKLPATGRELLTRPYAEPTHYGMGKHGWVTSKFNVAEEVPRRQVEQWIDESFRAIAPKQLAAATDADGRASVKAEGAAAATAKPAAGGRKKPAAAKADGGRTASAKADGGRAASAKADGGRAVSAKANDGRTTSAKADVSTQAASGRRELPSAKEDGGRPASAEADASAKAAGGRATASKPPTGLAAAKSRGVVGSAKGSTRRAVQAVLFCLDPMRAERAVAALAARAVGCAVATDAAKLTMGRARVLIVDVGRQPGDGLALAARVDASDAAVHLFVAGVRDAAQARQLRALGSAESFRVPPGDDRVADAVARALATTAAS